ncbi:hypothetical protein H4R33_003709 [Dimargaris cristalligena]|nr:hypothetical protein H4R33_003709 [Dimargaris cristalligena]
MTICRFFQKGNCTFGAKCKFKHTLEPGDKSRQSNATTIVGSSRRPIGGGSNQYAILDSSNNTWNSSNNNNSNSNRNNSTGPSNDPNPTTTTTGMTCESIRADMTTYTKMWPLTCYGPDKGYPNLIKNRDFSMDEARVMYYTALRNSRNTSAYESQMRKLKNAVNNDVQKIRNDIPKALETATAEFKRLQPGGTSMGSAFGQPPAPFGPSTSTGPGFVNNSGPPNNALGASSAFGAFGNPAPPPVNNAFTGNFALPPGPGFGPPVPCGTFQTAPPANVCGQPNPVSNGGFAAYANPAPAAVNTNSDQPMTRSRAPPHDYTPEEIKAFSAPEFVLGLIPEFEPPLQFRV